MRRVRMAGMVLLLAVAALAMTGCDGPKSVVIYGQDHLGAEDEYYTLYAVSSGGVPGFSTVSFSWWLDSNLDGSYSEDELYRFSQPIVVAGNGQAKHVVSRRLLEDEERPDEERWRVIAWWDVPGGEYSDATDYHTVKIEE